MSKLEDALDLPHDPNLSNSLDNIRKALHEQNTKVEQEAENLEHTSQELAPATQLALEKVVEREQRVEELVDLRRFDTDTDEIFTEAMAAFKNTFAAAGDIEGHAAAKAYEASVGFLKTALDAKNSKIKARLDAVSLALKKQQMEDKKATPGDPNDPIDANSSFLDRNELLEHIRSGLGTKDDKKDK